MDDAVDHLRAEVDTKRADDKHSESIAQDSQRDHETDQYSPPPRALEKQIAGQQTSDEKDQARTDTAALLSNLNENIR